MENEKKTYSIFVAGLDYSITSDQLKALFSGYGQVISANVVTLADGRSRGFGFVDMSTQEDMENAINSLHDSVQVGRKILVKQKEIRPPKRQYGNSRFSGHRGHDDN